MAPPPDYWYSITAVFAVVGIICFAVGIAVLVAVYRVLLDVRDAVKSVSQRIEALSQKVENITDTVQDMTSEVSTRTKGITRIVDQHASTGFTIVERFAPALVGIGIVLRLATLFRRR